MLPDGPPVLGASGADGVWLNLGHGCSGWALAVRLGARSSPTRSPAARRRSTIDGLGIERLRRRSSDAMRAHRLPADRDASPLHGVAATRAIEAARARRGAAVHADGARRRRGRAARARARAARAARRGRRRPGQQRRRRPRSGDAPAARRASDVAVALRRRRRDAARRRARTRSRARARAGVDDPRLGADDADGADRPTSPSTRCSASARRAPPEGAIAAAIARIAALAARGARCSPSTCRPGSTPTAASRSAPPASSPTHTLTLLTLEAGPLHRRRPRPRRRSGSTRSASTHAGARADAWLVGTRDPLARRAPRRHAQHKGSFGDVAVVGGAAGMAGAALLAARAAHAAGAGRVFVELLGATRARRRARPAAARADVARRGWWRGDAAALARATVVCGCGGGDAVRARAAAAARARAPRSCSTPTRSTRSPPTASLRRCCRRARARGRATVLTPHPLEAARLLGSTTARRCRPTGSRAARELADALRARSSSSRARAASIAAPDDAPRINATGNAALASAGTGDVLAGWIGGRWAQRSAATRVRRRDARRRRARRRGRAGARRARCAPPT